MSAPPVVLVTGAQGTLGRVLVAALAQDPSAARAVIASDLRLPEQPVAGVHHARLDITDADAVAAAFREHTPHVVVHLAAVVTPGPGQTRAQQYAVDVDGTRHVVAAAVETGVGKLIYTSSGAAYGYSPQNAPLLTEDDPLRSDETFAYAWHKRLVEELLADARRDHPALRQLVFRVGTILGAGVRNQITALFERPVVLGLRGVDTPFCFVWDEDVVACLIEGVRSPEKAGIYNLAGSGVMTPSGGSLGHWRSCPGVASPATVPSRSASCGTARSWATRPSSATSASAFASPAARPSRSSERPVPPDPPQVVAITGGAGDIGRAIAAAYLRRGARVALLDLPGERLDAAAQGLAAPDRVAALPCDITDPAACDRAIAAIEARFSGLDVLVNNAGLTQRSRFEDTAPDVIRRVIEVNLFGAMNCTRAALPALRRRRGTVAAISSVAGFAPLVGRTAYAASKHALHGFFDSLRTEGAPDVHVLLVCPSFVSTGFEGRAMGPDGRPLSGPRATIGRKLTPAEVADAVVDAVSRGQRQRLVSPVAHASFWLSRVAPGLYDRLMRRSQRAEFD